MTPEHLKAMSLYSALKGLFESARATRNYSLNALPEEEVSNLLVERLAPVLVEAEDLITRLAQRPRRLARASRLDVLNTLKGAA